MTSQEAEPPQRGTDGLTDLERAIWQIEARSWRPGSGSKERTIREQLGISPVFYYQYLNAMLDDPAATAAAVFPHVFWARRAMREQGRARREATMEIHRQIIDDMETR